MPLNSAPLHETCTRCDGPVVVAHSSMTWRCLDDKCGTTGGTSAPGPAPLMTWDRRAADALADEVQRLIERKVIDSRSPAADALLDYRDPGIGLVKPSARAKREDDPTDEAVKELPHQTGEESDGADGDDLVELMSLASAATPGPWRVHLCMEGSDEARDDAGRACGIDAVGSPRLVFASDSRDECHHPISASDAAFIAASRDGVPKLYGRLLARRSIAVRRGAQIRALWRMVSMLVSAVKSGEPWSPTLQAELEALR